MQWDLEQDVLTLAEAGQILQLSGQAIRLRIKRHEIKAHFDRGSRKLGYIIERTEFVRYLRSIGEDRRADLLEAQPGGKRPISMAK